MLGGVLDNTPSIDFNIYRSLLASSGFHAVLCHNNFITLITNIQQDGKGQEVLNSAVMEAETVNIRP